MMIAKNLPAFLVFAAVFCFGETSVVVIALGMKVGRLHLSVAALNAE